MIKSSKISLVFIMIFLIGIMGVIAMVNQSLNSKSPVDFQISPRTFVDSYTVVNMY